MKIELVAPNQVRITWPTYDAAIEAQILERLKTVPGIEGRGRRWYAPAIQVSRLIELFPKCSIGYDALRAADGLGRAFYTMLVRFHIELGLDASGAVCAVSGNVSPLIQQLIDERAHALRTLVAAERGTKRTAERSAVAMDRELESLAKGIENAKVKAEQDAIRYPKRRRKMTQGRLGL